MTMCVGKLEQQQTMAKNKHNILSLIVFMCLSLFCNKRCQYIVKEYYHWLSNIFWNYLKNKTKRKKTCYEYFENEWNVKKVRVTFPKHTIKTINIYSKEHNIPCDRILKNMFLYRCDYLNLIEHKHATVTLVVKNFDNFLLVSPNVKCTYVQSQYLLTDDYIEKINGRCYSIRYSTFYAIKRDYCNERELYATTQQNALLIATIHEQQNDFTQYNREKPWKAIDYIFADSFIIKTMCKY